MHIIPLSLLIRCILLNVYEEYVTRFMARGGWSSLLSKFSITEEESETTNRRGIIPCQIADAVQRPVSTPQPTQSVLVTERRHPVPQRPVLGE